MARTKETINPTFDGFQYLSPKQVTLGCYLKWYRMQYNMSQAEMAHICSLHGEPHNISFSQNEICKYEKYKTIPTPPKFQILMNTLGITPDML